MKQLIENIIYSYDPNEFFPVLYEGRLENKAEFVLYKVRRYGRSLTSQLTRR